MIVNFRDLELAVQKVKGLASDMKTVPGILLDIRDNEILVCYSDGKKSMVEKIDALVGENERLGQIVLAYASFLSAIEACQPSGILEVPEIEITVEDLARNELKITARKYVREYSGDDDEGDLREATKFTQSITYSYPDPNGRSAVLSRANYDLILEGEEYDEWSKDYLRELLGKMSKEDGKVIYFSRVVGAAYVVNLAYLGIVKTDVIKDHGFSIHTKMAKVVNDIVGKVTGDTIRLTLEDGRYCKMRSDDGKFGLWFEIAPVTQMDGTTLKRYESKEYTTYSLVMLKSALENAIKCAAATDKNEKTSLKFKRAPIEDDVRKAELELKDAQESMDGARVAVASRALDRENNRVVAEMNVGAASTSNNFQVAVTKVDGNVDDLVNDEIVVNLKVLQDILSNCLNNYIVLDVSSDPTGVYIRVSDVVSQDQTGAYEIGGVYYTVASKA